MVWLWSKINRGLRKDTCLDHSTIFHTRHRFHKHSQQAFTSRKSPFKLVRMLQGENNYGCSVYQSYNKLSEAESHWSLGGGSLICAAGFFSYSAETHASDLIRCANEILITSLHVRKYSSKTVEVPQTYEQTIYDTTISGSAHILCKMFTEINCKATVIRAHDYLLK